MGCKVHKCKVHFFKVHYFLVRFKEKRLLTAFKESKSTSPKSALRADWAGMPAGAWCTPWCSASLQRHKTSNRKSLSNSSISPKSAPWRRTSLRKISRGRDKTSSSHSDKRRRARTKDNSNKQKKRRTLNSRPVEDEGTKGPYTGDFLTTSGRPGLE